MGFSGVLDFVFIDIFVVMAAVVPIPVPGCIIQARTERQDKKHKTPNPWNSDKHSACSVVFACTE